MIHTRLTKLEADFSGSLFFFTPEFSLPTKPAALKVGLSIL